MNHSSLSRSITAPFFGGPIYVLFSIFAILPFVPLVLLALLETVVGGIRNKRTRLFLFLGWKLADKLEPIEKAILQRAVPEDMNVEDIKPLRLIPGSLLLCLITVPAFLVMLVCVWAQLFGEWLGDKCDALEDWVYG